MFILDTWSLTYDIWHLTIDMLSLSTDTLDLMLWHLTGYYYTRHLYYIVHSCYHFTGTWHDYYIVIIHLVLLNSCAPELLYSWTPVTGKLLILFSRCYTLVDPHNWLIIDIELLCTHCGNYHWTIYNKVLNLHRGGGNLWIPVWCHIYISRYLWSVV